MWDHNNIIVRVRDNIWKLNCGQKRLVETPVHPCPLLLSLSALTGMSPEQRLHATYMIVSAVQEVFQIRLHYWLQ